MKYFFEVLAIIGQDLSFIQQKSSNFIQTFVSPNFIGFEYTFFIFAYVVRGHKPFQVPISKIKN